MAGIIYIYTDGSKTKLDLGCEIYCRFLVLNIKCAVDNNATVVQTKYCNWWILHTVIQLEPEHFLACSIQTNSTRILGNYHLRYINTHLVGTLKASRKYLPKNVINAKLRRGDISVMQTNDRIVETKWRDNWDARMLSTKTSRLKTTPSNSRRNLKCTHSKTGMHLCTSMQNHQLI